MVIRHLRIFLLLICYSLFLLSLPHCTSSDDETSVLESEIENMDVEGMDDAAEGVDDLEDVAENDIADELDDESDDVADLEDELDDEIDKDVADSDSDLDDEFDDDEFDEFDEFDEKEEQVAKNEKALEQELNQQNQMQDYPEVQDFPNEVVGEQNTVAVTPSDSVITSETQEVPDPLASNLPQDDLGQAELGHRPHQLEVRECAEGLLDTNRDLLLDLLRAQCRRFGVHLHHHVRHVRKSIDRQFIHCLDAHEDDYDAER